MRYNNSHLWILHQQVLHKQRNNHYILYTIYDSQLYAYHTIQHFIHYFLDLIKPSILSLLNYFVKIKKIAFKLFKSEQKQIIIIKP